MINHCELFIYFDNEVNIFTKFDLYKINVNFLSI